jgi:1,2-diacylglycerol 3-beta-glucosyltransferase
MSNILYRATLQPSVYFAAAIGIGCLAQAVIGLSVTVGLSIFAPTIVVDTSFLTLYFFFACTLYNVFVIGVVCTGKVVEGEDVAHYFSIVVPARNEESVIGETLKRIFEMDYPSELFEVLVVNDASKDATESVVQNLQAEHANLKLLNIASGNGGLGKGAALNAGFGDFLFTWRGLEVEPRHRWIVGVFDADAMPDRDILRKVSFEFRDPRVGGVQTLVRISNRDKSFLAKLQDIEFITFSRVLQFSRTIFKGSVALGGNGQFIRADALDAVSITKTEEYWNRDSLTEDLEIGVRLLEKKWENRYVGHTAVYQQGVESFSSLFRQRTRWAWGTFQVIRHHVFSLKLWKPKIGVKKKFDVCLYLFTILVPIIVLLSWVASALSLAGAINIHNFFPLVFTVANSFSFIPFFVYGLWKERKEYPPRQIIPLSLAAIVYTYHWIPCVLCALFKSITKKPFWEKTPRTKPADTVSFLTYEQVVERDQSVSQ